MFLGGIEKQRRDVMSKNTGFLRLQIFPEASCLFQGKQYVPGFYATIHEVICKEF